MTTIGNMQTRHIALAHMTLSIALVAFGAIVGG